METLMFTKTAYALIGILLLSSVPATAMEEGAASAYALPRSSETYAAGNPSRFVSGTEAYASAGRSGVSRNRVIRQQPQNVRPFTHQEKLWFRTAQGYDDKF
jgi:hypothetical protein